MDDTRLAFSYIRFSSDRQHLGDSLRRQICLAEHYAHAHEMVLDTHSYQDLGVSAYRGRNAVEGKLSAFISAIDSGLIQPNAYLLIESLDRLSRNDVDEALELFLSIIRRGVSIVTLSDNQLYNTASIKKDRGISLIISITIMMRANEESELKSLRGREAWRAKLQSGGVLTRMGPAWLELINGHWSVRDALADIVRNIFELALLGHGSVTICRMLNEIGIPTLGRSSHWTPSMVTRIISNPAVYGTLRREKSSNSPVENYYPSIVSRENFFRVRDAAGGRARKIIRKEKLTPSNLFSGFCYCAGCGSRVFSVSGHREQYILQCYKSYVHGGCQEPAVKGALLEHPLLDELLSGSNQGDVGGVTRGPFQAEEARHLCAALCGGRASKADRSAIRKRLQNLMRQIIDRIVIDPRNRCAILTYRQGMVVTLSLPGISQTCRK